MLQIPLFMMFLQNLDKSGPLYKGLFLGKTYLTCSASDWLV